MKGVVVTQWVRVTTAPVPPDESLTRRSVGNSTCIPSNGRTKLEGPRRQAARWSPEMPIMVDSRISLTCRGESRRSPTTGRQQSQPRYGEWMGSHRGLRAGHVFRGVTRELRRANASPCGTSGVGVPSREVKTPGAERQLAPLTRATCENKRDTKPAERHKGSGKDREHRTTPRWAIGSRSVS